MASKNNKSSGANSDASTGAGMQVSGEEIFREPETEMHRVSEEEVQAAFGGEAATTGKLTSDESSTTAQTSSSGDQIGQTGDQSGQAVVHDVQPEPSENAKAAAANVGEVLRGNTAPVTDAAKDAFNQVKGAAGSVAGQALGQVQEKAGSAIEAQKQNLTEGLTSVAGSIRSLGGNLRNSDQAPAIAQVAARYSDTVADQVEQLAEYFETRDLRDLSRDVQGFARRNPTVFVAGAFTLGLLAARFFKSSPRQELVRADYYNTDFSGGSEQSSNRFESDSSVRSTSGAAFDLNSTTGATGSTTTGASGAFGTTATGTTTTDPLLEIE